MSKLRGLFDRIAHNAIRAKTTKEAYDMIDKGLSVIFKPRSNRYTREANIDKDYDKSWTATTAQEKKTLSPKGYWRVGERAENDAKLGINENNRDLMPENTISINSTFVEDIKIDNHGNPNAETVDVLAKFPGSNKWYRYPSVRKEDLQAVVRAPSFGEAFWKHIHDKYTLNPGHRPQGKAVAKAYKTYFKKRDKELKEARREERAMAHA